MITYIKRQVYIILDNMFSWFNMIWVILNRLSTNNNLFIQFYSQSTIIIWLFSVSLIDSFILKLLH